MEPSCHCHYCLHDGHLHFLGTFSNEKESKAPGSCARTNQEVEGIIRQRFYLFGRFITNSLIAQQLYNFSENLKKKRLNKLFVPRIREGEFWKRLREIKNRLRVLSETSARIPIPSKKLKIKKGLNTHCTHCTGVIKGSISALSRVMCLFSPCHWCHSIGKWHQWHGFFACHCTEKCWKSMNCSARAMSDMNFQTLIKQGNPRGEWTAPSVRWWSLSPLRTPR